MKAVLRSIIDHPALPWFSIGVTLAFLSLTYNQPFVLLYAGLAACYGLRFFDPQRSPHSQTAA